ncbi:hypothetical protein [Neptuniibacter sp. QD37_11]|uniref:hypothetical protein n=1 Tax=Neptuniibacter sp. QD37_11 TaxID=3398209 RepID=UPI0039F57C0A
MARVSNKMLHHLAKRPADLVRFNATGRLPNSVRPVSPLISILEEISPRDRLEIKGIRISQLGYMTDQVWQNAEQLYRWLKPDSEVIGAYPAGSRQDKRFNRPLSLQDIKDNSHTFPPHLEAKIPVD